jgi:ketosteroid isomerase-like protein
VLFRSRISVEREAFAEVAGQIVVPMRWRGAGRSSGVEGQFSFTSVFTVADGTIRRARNFATRAEALDALALGD